MKKYKEIEGQRISERTKEDVDMLMEKVNNIFREYVNQKDHDLPHFIRQVVCSRVLGYIGLQRHHIVIREMDRMESKALELFRELPPEKLDPNYQEHEVEDKLLEVVANTLKTDRDKIQHETNLTEDFDLDSLDGVELVMAIEDEFGISISEDEYVIGIEHNKETFKDLLDTVLKKIKKEK